MTKMTKKDITEVKRTIRWLGFNETSGKCGMLVAMYAVVVIILILNNILFLINKWDTPEERVDALNGITIYFVCVIHYSALLFNWKNFILLLNALQCGKKKLPTEYTANQITLRREINEDITRLNTAFYYVLKADGIIVILAPIIIIIFRVIQNGVRNVSSDMVYTFVTLYFPENHENIFAYLLLITIQSFFFIYSIKNAYVVMEPAFNSMQLVSGELKLLILMIKEMDDIIENNIKLLSKEVAGNLLNSHTSILLQLHAKALNTFLRSFVEEHCKVYRKVHDVTRGLQLVAFSHNIGFSVLLCTTVYRLVKTSDMMTIGQEAFYSCILIVCLYCYGLMGEKVSTESDNLRKALFESHWVDKPMWFKKSLLLIITRTNRSIEIKTFGLAVLSLRNFLRTVQAAYSYYNVLNNF